VSDPTTSGQTILAGKQRVQGGEVGVTGQVTPRWNVLANYSYLEGKYVASPNPDQVGVPFTNVPKHSVNTWATYRVLDGLTVGGGARYMDKRLLRLTDTSRVYVPSYHTYDAMAAYQLTPTVGVQLNLYNLSDKLYYDSGRMWVPAAGRSVSVTTSMKF
jgi:catecholate siderophore receptor